LIESNAMKKLITLILSAVFLCPMWAGAQSTPSVIGTLNWTVAELPITILVPPSPTVPAIVTVANMIGLTISITSLQTGSGFYSLTGFSLDVVDSASYNVPLTGAMIESGSFYTMSFTTGQNQVACEISAATLNGNCTTSNSGSLMTKRIVLVLN